MYHALFNELSCHKMLLYKQIEMVSETINLVDRVISVSSALRVVV
eukprot:XP_001706615.1 Hypothetical protein GL50803_3422 [Giardia lamblia ATCC 50803]